MKQDLFAFFLRMSFWMRDIMKGGCILSHYKNIRLIQEHPEQGNIERERLLTDILRHAVMHTTFYKHINPSSLSNFPIVTKTILIDNYDNIRVDPVYLPWQKGAYHIQRTSGSTGTPFAVPQDVRKRNRRLAELKYFGRLAGFKSHDKLVHLRIWTKWQNKTKKQSFKENIIPYDISNLNEDNLQVLYDTLKSTRAKCVRGYASSFDLLAKFVEKYHLDKLPHLRIAIATSETLYDSTCELVEKYIGCKIISQYANEENGILAQQQVGDSSRRFYLNEASYFFEVLKFDSDEPAEYGELGRIVITDFFNYAFPLIRYDNGDTCIMQLDEKTNHPYIAQLYGRRLDLVYNTKNEPVFPMVLARILKNYSEISQWQFIQETSDLYCLKIVLRNLSKLSYSEEIVIQLKEYFGLDAKISIKYVQEIPVQRSGKRKCVVCNKEIK